MRCSLSFEGEDAVRYWLDATTRGQSVWFDEWLSYWEDSPRDADFGEFSKCWGDLERVAGGSLSRSNELDVRLLFGSVAESHDWEYSRQQDDVRLHHVAAREALIGAGLAPSGAWEARLLGDLFENAQITFRSWRELNPDGASAQLTVEAEKLHNSALELIDNSTNVAARRSAHAVAAVCALHIATPTDINHHVASFFALDEQAMRESGSEADERDLRFVTVAGAAVRAAEGDRDGVQELMRRVRQRVEPPGERLPHAYMALWATAMMTLDPQYAQMLAQQLLIDETAEGITDDSFAAAFLLLEASLAVDDAKTMLDLMIHWPTAAREIAAREVESGPGVQLWLNNTEFGSADDFDDIDGIDDEDS